MTRVTHSLRHRAYLIEWLIILLLITAFSHVTLLDFDSRQLQQTGEHNESATLPILTEIGLRRYGEIPLWNPYMLTGFPHAGDTVSHFWNPVATIPVMLWGGITGMKVSVFLSLLVAAYGQWLLSHTFGIRGLFRLWAGLLFALSGGLVLLWRLGWYELLVGAAWFPWCFALLWLALHRRGNLLIVAAAASIALVLTTGGGYYPFYLGVSLIVLTLVALFQNKPAQRGRLFARALAVAVLGLGLAAVYWVPLVDGLRYTARDAPPDVTQVDSQPIPYALFNYVVSDEQWFSTNVLNKQAGFGWFYIGFLPLLAMAFTPWLFGRFSWRRRHIAALLILLLVLLFWHANRHAPVRYLYEWIPFLYTFRFPNRLLIIATIPIVVLAAMNLQGLLVWMRRGFRGLRFGITAGDDGRSTGISFIALFNVSIALLMILVTVDVYRVNRTFGMHPNPRPAVVLETLGWLRLNDTSLYYTSVGDPFPSWSWVADAYEMEMPILNFRYNRRVRSMDAQHQPESPFFARPKYLIIPADQAQPAGAELMTTIRNMNVWRQPDALPYAFSVIDPTGPINRQTAREQSVYLDGPNRVVVDGAAESPGEQLVALVSDYPGWRLSIDGEPAEVVPLNGYLGAQMLPGEHEYVFEFRPMQNYIGLAITIASLLACAALQALDWRQKRTSN